MTCRICLEPDNLVSVCACRGTQGLVHQECVQRWVDLKPSKTCELCLQPYDPVYVQVPEELDARDDQNVYVVAITTGVLLNGVAAAGLSTPVESSILIESCCFCFANVYFWHAVFKHSAKWSVLATLIWGGVFILLTGILRVSETGPVDANNVYAVFLMLWTHSCCLGRSLYHLRTTRPPNESHITV